MVLLAVSPITATTKELSLTVVTSKDGVPDVPEADEGVPNAPAPSVPEVSVPEYEESMAAACGKTPPEKLTVKTTVVCWAVAKAYQSSV